MKFHKRILLLSMVAVWIGVMNRGVQASSHVCSDVCDAAACDAECWLTQSDFDNGYPATNCGAQGYSCCGDGVCDPGSGEACNGCTADCDTVSDCGGCTPGSCSSGEICNAARQCVQPTDPETGEHTPTCGGDCDTDGDCCGSDVCLPLNSYGGQKECGVPDTTYCPDAPSCSSSEECNGLATNWATQNNVSCTLKDLYCDPGIGRCQFNEDPGCPEFNGFSLCED